MIVRISDEITVNGVTEYSYRKNWYAPDVGPIIYRKYTQNWSDITISQELVSFSLIVNLTDYDKLSPIGSWWKYSYIYPSGQNDFSVSITKITSGPYIGKLRMGDWYEYHPTGTEIRWMVYDIFEENAILYEESGQAYDPPLVVNINELVHELECFVNCSVYPGFYSKPNYMRKEEKITVLAGTFYDILIEFNIDSEKGYPPNSSNYIYGLDPVKVPYAVTHIRWKAKNIGLVKCVDIDSETGEIMHQYELKSSYVPSPSKATPWIPLLLVDE